MEYRPLGRTGVSVSQLCLGAMMFGAFGNADHDDSVRIIHKALDAGINFIDTADGYSAGESELILGKALAGGRRDNVVLAVKFGLPMGRTPTIAERGGGGSLKRSRARCAGFRPIGSTSTKWAFLIPDRHRRDARRHIRPGARGQDPLLRCVEGPCLSNRRGAMDRRSPRSRAVSHRTAALLLVDPGHRIRRATDLPALTEWASWPTAHWPVVGCRANTARDGRLVGRAPPLDCNVSAGAGDASNPENAAKLNAADALGALADEAGLTLVQMAVAFAVRHPAVTSTIIGPRTMEHLDGYLAADGIELSDDVLNRIDEIVPPGVTVNVVDNMWNVGTTSLDAASRRR